MRLPFTSRKQKTAHQHYWLLDDPNGPMTKGICINSPKHDITGCGATKDFPNSHEGSAWQTKSRMLESMRKGASRGGKAAVKQRRENKKTKKKDKSALPSSSPNPGRNGKEGSGH